MTWNLTDVTKILGLKARYYFCAWVFGSLVIFLPTDIKEQMAITIPEAIGPWLGFSTLAAFVLWFVLAVFHLASYIRRWLYGREAKAETLSFLETLSQEERDIFIQCLSLKKRTIHRNITDGAANSLKQKRLLVMASQGSILSMAHTIPKFVWEHIKANEAELFPEISDKNAMKEFQRRQQNGWMR